MRRLPALLALAIAACARPGAPAEAPGGGAQARLAARPSPRFPAMVELLERRGTGRVRYLGFDITPEGPLSPGQPAELRHYFEVLAPLRGEYAIVAELYAPGAATAAASDAHRPRPSTHAWAAGELWSDTHKLRLPAAGPALELRVALSENGERMTVEAAGGGQDGSDRLRAGTIEVDMSQAPPPDDGLPVVIVPRATSSITPDGELLEAAWAKAPTLSFSDTMGRPGELRFPTRLKLLWDDEFLYVGFDSRDEDVTCPYEKRDDPIYDHETVEVFLMPETIAPALGPYVELQASPKGVIFDASFTGRRQGMDKRFDAQQLVGTKVRGTLNDPAPDEGWTSEWKVPWKGLRFVSRPPKVGDEWRMNAFRIEKYREGGQERGEYGAWSPPRVGDFHATDRFGRMRFGP